MVQQVLKLPEVVKLTGMPKSSIYSLIAQGAFPKPIPLHGRAVGWLEGDLEAWQRERKAQGEQPPRKRRRAA